MDDVRASSQTEGHYMCQVAKHSFAAKRQVGLIRPGEVGGLRWLCVLGIV